MNQDRKRSVLVGVLILAAYSIVGSNNPGAKTVGMTLEIISGISVIGIAVLMFPYLKPHGPKVSTWYLTLKGVEGVLMVVAGVLFLIHTESLLTLRDNIYRVHGYIFAVPALMFYYLLFKSKIVPGWLSIWGGIAAILLVAVNVLELAGVIPMIEALYIPIVLNEFVLALWLIFKGFNFGRHGLQR